MADSLKALLEERATAAKEIRTLADVVNNENRDFNAEEREKWEKVNGDYDRLSRKIDVVQRAADIDRQQKDPAGDTRTKDVFGGERRHGGDGAQEVTEEHRALALQAWCRSQMDLDLSDEHVDACERTGMNPNRRKLDLVMPESRHVRQLAEQFRSVHPSIAHRALSAIDAAKGGSFVPESFISQLEVNMLAFGGVRQVAEILRTNSGEPMTWPTVNDTGNKGRRIVENEAVDTTGTKTAEPTAGSIAWYAHKYTSDAVLVPTELMENSPFDMVTLLGQLLGERLGRITNEENTTGTGNSMPKGIVTASELGVETASAAAIASDEIIRMIHSVDPAYRIGARWMMHDAILLQIRLLKDSNGQYLWQSGLQAGVPDRLLSYEITINQDMDSTLQAGKKTMLFGQLSKYKVREVRGIRLYRLEERYRENDQDGFVAFLRQDGNLLHAGTNPIKHLKQKAA